MDVKAACEKFAGVLTAGKATESRNTTLRAARQVVIDHCFLALGREAGSGASISAAMRLAAESADRAALRDCAVLIVHALGVPGLIPPAAGADVRVLVERGLHSVLLRCGYPFAESTAEKMAALERLHHTIDELMQPLEPTFPNWQGLYAG
jgi:hypothetical protein